MVKSYFETKLGKLYHGDCLEILKQLPDKHIQCCITSPPYWGLRDYGVDGQIGLEPTLQEYVEKLVIIFREVRRVLKDDGTIWLNLGDSYSGGGRGGDPKHLKGDNSAKATMESYKEIPAKNLLGIPWRVAFALQSNGWYLRQDIIWHKLNPVPESVMDRCTRAHEYIFLLSKSARYYYDADTIKEKAMPDNSNRDRNNTKMNNTPGRTKMGGLKTNHYIFRNKRSVWSIAAQPSREAHFAVFPQKLIEPCILAGSKKGDIVLDLFSGAGTTVVMAGRYKRQWIGIELNEDYCVIQKKRIKRETRQLTIT